VPGLDFSHAESCSHISIRFSITAAFLDLSCIVLAEAEFFPPALARGGGAVCAALIFIWADVLASSARLDYRS
jgi:hypothetical protein